MLEEVTPSALHLQDHQGVILKINVQFGFNKSGPGDRVVGHPTERTGFTLSLTFVVVFSAVTGDQTQGLN